MSFSIFDSEEPQEQPASGLSKARQEYLEACVEKPELYFWGKDPDTGIPVVRTIDPHDRKNPVKGLPDWAYQRFLVAAWFAGFFSEQQDEAVGKMADRHAVDKPRQLLVSWLLAIWMDYIALFHPYQTNLLNKATEDEAKKMIQKRLEKGIHKNWPGWFKDWAQARWLKNDGVLEYGRTSSVVAATGENVDDRAARGDVASVFGVDEAARHPRLREVVAALMPMAKQVILVSTPEIGTPGSMYMAEILKEGELG